MKPIVPIYLLSGFLGSGKTTLLNQLLDYYVESGQKPALIMNEIGDINVDGQLIGSEVPMAELLSGCICCTISGDLGVTLLELCREYKPDVIVIESTGVANPMEIMDSITEASLFTETELRLVVTVVDTPYLLELARGPKGKTFRLMHEQIRCAGWLILNKIDQMTEDDLKEAERLVRSWNPHSPMRATIQCRGSLDFLFAYIASAGFEQHEAGKTDFYTEDGEEESGPGGEEKHDCGQHHHKLEETDKCAHRHSSYDHVMVYTHYFNKKVGKESFLEMIRQLPKEVYRAKGIVTFSGEVRPVLFQYAFRELDFLAIRPRTEVPNSAVFIGEHFSADQLTLALAALENVFNTENVDETTAR
ncbi:CobW family GTP-binding protein [Paenibacillus beijingensis]|uniref:Cobalamin biosynthesis protein n=1 Tax=Paenibacillus beijingensis TaxID=1126833 RepID=A0A0D5NLV5_9BACL|nr:CobW family GTP-binding protein [Paenibacillus beijingensis]AJY76236.1 hypothetical protein VN24_18810 [Paenibacillus beijingensis]